MNVRNVFFASAVLLLISGAYAVSQTMGPPGTGAGTVATTSRTTPGYAPGAFYPMGNFVGATSVAVPTLDTVVFLYPFAVYDESLIATSLNTRTITGVASCTNKMAVWLTDATTKRPTGLPVIGSNTAQNCATSSTTQTIAVSYTFQPGIVYWAGSAVSTGASQFYSCNVSNPIPGLGVWGQLGLTAIANVAICSVTAPYTFATDITALNLTGATFTRSGSSGVPIMYIGN